ncbi:hypothetical protein [Psychroflexus aestuariivivens]|uniref:hypothetical protein n=1 Tax=Psychroflexus aestuariivivens TaxID=1795040 RepID=UPI000FD87621|nr:hypothetical protein [Psychroflexus aestuariivivens]
MKSTILVVFLTMLFSISNLSAQSSGWSDWKSVNCFKGVDFRVKSTKTSTGKYDAYVEFRNRYYDDVHFNYEGQGGNYTTKNNRVTIKA